MQRDAPSPLRAAICRGKRDNPKPSGVAKKVLADIAQLPIEIVDADLELARSAAELQAENKLPYTDCFAAALAVHRKASPATSDKDFARVEKKLEILWTLGL
jgi:predicted nucleic acid-binding protein